mgnify:FL=1
MRIIRGLVAVGLFWGGLVLLFIKPTWLLLAFLAILVLGLVLGTTMLIFSEVSDQ